MSETKESKERRLRRIFNYSSILYEMCDELMSDMEMMDDKGNIDISEHDEPAYIEIGKIHSELENRMESMAQLIKGQA